MRIGYVGLGAMGGALARHLVPRHTVTVFDLNESALAEFTALGARSAKSCADLARDCDIVLLCLPRSSDVERVLFGPSGLAEGLAPGSIVVDQTSGVPDQTRAFARRLQQQGVGMMDAPVSGNQASAHGGTIAIIASGPRAAYDTALPVLKDISPNVMYCGEQAGNGQMMKTVNNLLNVTTRFATLELVALGRKMGLPLAQLTEALTSTAGRSHTSKVMLPAIAEGRETVKFYLALQVKDMNQAITLGTAQGVPMPIGIAARSLLQIGLSSLGPNAQLEEMIGVVERMAGTRFVEDGVKEGAK
ncbi:NAD(P)-dependent oxidoreductase [Variovorax sp. LjRoot178]|uniref:NAD(P)-dependent oxidoreductase n=1 Tax=Variovorax sp. LjRoot178 TaxID=3342277 RepID=UPI003ECF0620